MKRFPQLLFVLLLIISCEQFNTDTKEYSIKNDKPLIEESQRLDNEFLIHGTIFNSDSEMIYLVKTENDSLVKTDSTRISNNSFQFSGLAKIPELYSITKNIEHIGYTFLIDNSDINLFYNQRPSLSNVFSSSQVQKDYSDYVLNMEEFKSRGIQLYYGLKGDFSPKNIYQLKKDRASLFSEQNKFTSDFINDHPNSYYSALLVKDHVQILNAKSARNLFNLLSPEIRSLAISKNIEELIIEKETLTKKPIQLNAKPPKDAVTSSGEYRPRAYAITGKNQYGETMSLASIPKGKVVLIDFWASWCAPCRATNPNLVRLNNLYKDKGLVILSISEDKGEAEWMNAINADNLTWDYHIIDKNKSIAFRYGVESIPFKLLIDKKGRIASEKISGRRLESRIQELLSE